MAKANEAAATEAAQDHTQAYELGNRVSRSTIAVIDTVVQRGGFKGEELSTIGQLRDQAMQFVQLAEGFQSEAAGDTE